MSRILISGTSSGCGKTTVTCAVLSALKARGITPTAFKCGPDYIDPMFHRAALGLPSYNLDPFFLDGDGLRRHIARDGLCVIEGAMGYYDGIATTSDASAYTAARETDTPVILVVSAKGSGSSLGAVIGGFIKHRPDSGIKGVIFNDAIAARYPDLQQIAEAAGVRAYGFMPRNEKWSMPSRHLGLMTADEISDLAAILTELGRQAEQSLDIDGLLQLAETAQTLTTEQASKSGANTKKRGVKIAVARDEAFCFTYEENLEFLCALGCELVFFSPLHDTSLPADIGGLYLPGGYPELHTKALSANSAMLDNICGAVGSGLPTVAECGGFMYLHDTLDGCAMSGVIRGDAYKTERLQRFGYITLIARHDNLLCNAGESIRAHEFHYWDSTEPGGGFTAQKAGRSRSWDCIHASKNLYAGFPHLYFPANPEFAVRFVKAAARFEDGIEL